MEDQSKVQESTPMITDSNSDAASNNHKNENANDIPIVELSYSQQLVANGWCPVKKEYEKGKMFLNLERDLKRKLFLG